MSKLLQKLVANLPSRVRITKDVTYEVVSIDDFKDPGQLGEMRPVEKQIVIKSGQSLTETLKTFIHETIHAASNEDDINLTETQVRKLEDSIFRILKLNNFLAFLGKVL